MLSEKCYKCHSEKSAKVKGGLLLDTREGTRRGGDSGPAVVPGSLDDSILIEAIRYTNKDFAMPPEKSGGKLPEAVIKDFETWVKMGAPDPRDGHGGRREKIQQGGREELVGLPAAETAGRAAAEECRVGARGHGPLSPRGARGEKAEARRRCRSRDLLRRIYFDLTGLPPSPIEVGQFFNDWKAVGANPKTAARQQQAVLGKWVDKLLASPQFGERWGRHWLDVARYAESSGKDVNIAFPHAWRYRDYVIEAFNQDKPYDQFLREQLAGDLLPAGAKRRSPTQLVATGFLAVGPKGLNEQNPRQFCLDLADEQVDTVSQAMLGLTISCARCHDHKFDPISQREYYALAGIFLSTDTLYGTASGIQNRHATELIASHGRAGDRTRRSRRRNGPDRDAAGGFEKRAARTFHRALCRRSERRHRLGESIATHAACDHADRTARDATEKLRRERPREGARDGREGFAGGKGGGRLWPIRRFSPPRPSERQGRPPEFSSDRRQCALCPRRVRQADGEGAAQISRGAHARSLLRRFRRSESGRRELAEWITSPSNPLTSRVMVNRVWHTLFGRGIVESVDNFGTTGKTPSNQALLDFLAVKFQTPVSAGGYGWSVKKLAKDIVMSHAYQLSSGLRSRRIRGGSGERACNGA